MLTTARRRRRLQSLQTLVIGVLLALAIGVTSGPDAAYLGFVVAAVGAAGRGGRRGAACGASLTRRSASC